MFDVCIIGGGTVGLFLAAQLSKDGKKVLILELGSHSGLDRRAVVGSNPQSGGHIGAAASAWTTGLGGSSQLWGGQLWPWQEWEFTRTGPGGGPIWPIGKQDLSKHYRGVLNVLGLSQGHSIIHDMGRPPTCPKVDLGDDFSVRYSTWMGARARNLARNSAVQKQLRSVNIVTGAAVHGLEICHDGSTDVQYSRGNEDCSLRARQVVLAAGTLGNSRILSRCSFVSGSDLVGSGFMDHVSARVLKLDVTDWDRFLDVFAYRRYKGVLAAPRIVPHPQYLANRDIVPSYAHFEIASAPGGMVDVAKSFRGARQGNGPYPKAIEMLDAGRRDFWPTASAVGRSLLRHERPVLKSSTVYLRIDAEQPHRPENFIAWNGSKPYASRDLNLEMKWHVGTREKTAIEVMKKDVEAVLDRFNIGGSFEPLRNKFEITDTYHLMGGTAMQTAARPGVVDKECRVLGSQNVFVAGASVFPSGGMANPTFTALALAHRLGEQLG